MEIGAATTNKQIEKDEFLEGKHPISKQNV